VKTFLLLSILLAAAPVISMFNPIAQIKLQNSRTTINSRFLPIFGCMKSDGSSEKKRIEIQDSSEKQKLEQKKVYTQEELDTAVNKAVRKEQIMGGAFTIIVFVGAALADRIFGKN
jgi:hypothetical protein